MNHLLNEGYQIIVGGRALTKLNRDHGHGIAALKHKFDFPGDYVPGKDDDLSDNFHPGSLGMNEEKQMFMCVDDTEGQANWIHIGSLAENATAESFINTEEDQNVEPQNKTSDETTTEPDEEGSGKDVDGEPSPSDDEAGQQATGSDEGSEDTDSGEPEESGSEGKGDSQPKTDGSGDSFQMGAQAGPNKGKTAIPEDMPWSKYLTDHNGLETIEEVQEKANNGELTDLSYLNKERAQDIALWLDEN